LSLNIQVHRIQYPFMLSNQTTKLLSMWSVVCVEIFIVIHFLKSFLLFMEPESSYLHTNCWHWIQFCTRWFHFTN